MALAEQWRPASEKELRASAGAVAAGQETQAGPPSPSRAQSAGPGGPSHARPTNKQPTAAPAKDAAKDAPSTKDAVKDAAGQTAAASPPSLLPLPQRPPPPPRLRLLAGSSAAWNRAIDHHDTADDLKQVLAFVDAAENQPREDGGDGTLKADVVEVQFLRMLAAYLDAKVWGRPELIGRAWLRGNWPKPRSPSPDLVTQYWIQHLVDAADADRRLAEDKLYVGSPDALKQAESHWENAAAAEGEGGKYREALRRAQVLAKALAVRDRAWAEGPYLAQCILGAACRRASRTRPTFARCWTARRSYAALLEDTPESDQWPAELPQATAQVEDALKKLSAAYGDECYARCEPSRTTPTHCGGSPPCSRCRLSPAPSATHCARNRWPS